MAWLFRSNLLVLAVLGLALAAAWVVWPFAGYGPTTSAAPKPLANGDQEIVWLNPATSTVTWERFVAAARRLVADRKEFILDDSNAFPSQTTAVPEFAIALRSGKTRLWFRWYKLTGDFATRQWVQALGQRHPSPLAIVGGGTSDRARDLAQELNELPVAASAKPLMLVTSATADQIYLDDKVKDLVGASPTGIYPDRGFRFCFTNKQMAHAVADFIWSTDDLRPDRAPMYLIQWKDDPYSEDLSEQFHYALTKYLKQLPKGPDKALGPPPAPFWSLGVPYSVGTFNQPNRWEADAVERLVNVVSQHPEQQRPLLVLPAIPQPARRFLRGLARTDPILAGRFVVATGDGIDFNTIYRDRNLAWPIQDLPCDLVFFCHRNPVDPSAFREDQLGDDQSPPNPNEKTTTGTQDLLLYRDIVETVALAAARDGGWLDQPDDLARRLVDARLPDGSPRFKPGGNQYPGASEYVVVLRPVRKGNRVRPEASLQVWNRSAVAEGKGHWTLVRKLSVDYLGETGVSPQEGGP
jgi:hypothetical protein